MLVVVVGGQRKQFTVGEAFVSNGALVGHIFDATR